MFLIKTYSNILQSFLITWKPTSFFLKQKQAIPFQDVGFFLPQTGLISSSQPFEFQDGSMDSFGLFDTHADGSEAGPPDLWTILFEGKHMEPIVMEHLSKNVRWISI